jgi:alpha-tubulin suppressor-like RCC1 family protein
MLRAAIALSVLLVAQAPTSTPAPSAPAPATPGPKVLKIVGESHKLALRADGSVVGWGLYNSGQLGPVADITGVNFRTTHLVTIHLPAKAVDVAAGDRSSFAVLDDGRVFAWGMADAGQLGLGDVTAPPLSTSTPSMQYRGVETPRPIPGLIDVAKVAADGPGGYAVLRDGTVRVWGRVPVGDGRAPQTFSGPSTDKGPVFSPIPVPGLRDVVSVSIGYGAALALTKDGRVFSWGSNFYGALGRPPRSEFWLDAAAEIPGLTDVAQVVAGAGVATALKKDGTVWVWGSNWMAQFGFGPQTSQPNLSGGWVLEPQQVPGLTNVTSVAVGLSGRHTLALLKDGSVRAWGNNDWGQVGSGLGAGFQPRIITPKITGVEIIYAAGNNSFATRRDGSFWAWGSGDRNTYPLTTNARVPTLVELK